MHRPSPAPHVADSSADEDRALRVGFAPFWRFNNSMTAQLRELVNTWSQHLSQRGENITLPRGHAPLDAKTGA